MNKETMKLEQRITDYLSAGGLFNPELADHVAVRDLLIDCREALAEQQEPVAWLVDNGGDSILIRHSQNFPGVFVGSEFNKRPLVFGGTSPPAQRKPLTVEEIGNLLPDDDTPMSLGEAFVKFARAIEAAHGIKGNT